MKHTQTILRNRGGNRCQEGRWPFSVQANLACLDTSQYASRIPWRVKGERATLGVA